MDAITLLKDDHKTVNALFRRYEKAGDGANVEKRQIVDRIVEELAVHAAVEEQLFYPVVRATVPDTEDLALESLEEHGIVKWLLADLEKMDPTDERFDAKVTVLIENVRHHVEEEENDFFPMVRDELGRNALGDLGDAMAEAKKTAPTHPHPRSPDTPPGNIVAGTLAGTADRIGDTVSGAAQGGVSAIGDLVATILRRKKPARSPRGSSVSRSAARSVRSKASSVTEDAIAAVKEAKQTGEATLKGAGKAAGTARKGTARTAKAAASGSKSTATSAKKSARRTTTAAKSSARTTATSAKRAATKTANTAKKAAKSTKTTARRSAAARKSA